jgi:hypothetical protein
LCLAHKKYINGCLTPPRHLGGTPGEPSGQGKQTGRSAEGSGEPVRDRNEPAADLYGRLAGRNERPLDPYGRLAGWNESTIDWNEWLTGWNE